ncbi:MAG: hydrogen gas-evolving membrane-bound hydrogenase subunit E [Bacillota bacterium]
MPVEIWLYIFLGVMIAASIITLEMKNILSALVALGAVGLILSLSFLILQAPDLALVQFIYEILILSVVIIIMTVTRNERDLTDLKEKLPQVLLAFLILVPILFFSYHALRGLPAFGSPLLKVSARYLSHGAKETGSANIVTAVILDYRIYDTFGEATVIMVGILGTITIIRKIGRKRHETE